MRIDADHRRYLGSDLEAMSCAGNYYRWIIRQFRPFLEAREVVEVGAGSGNFTRFLLEASPLSVACVEPSENMFPRLRERFGRDRRVRLVQGFLGDVEKSTHGGFDTAVYVNVLEHVEHDVAEMATVHRLLRPGGHLLIWVPALPGLMSKYDRALGHFRRYTRRTLRELIAGAGLQIERHAYYDFAGILPWWLCFTVAGMSLQAGQVSLYDRAVVPLTTALESVMAPPVGKNLLLVARKA